MMGNIFYYRLCRHAFFAALKVNQIGRGDLVLVPSYICRDFLSPIHAVGAQPLYYDITPELTPFELPYQREVRAVVAVNYFGFPQDLTTFRNYCEKHKILLIEDNAHGFLSKDSDGQLLGYRGDIGLFSMRKSILIPDGAALVVNKPNIVKPPTQIDCTRAGVSAGFYIKRYLSLIQLKTGIKMRSYAESVIRFMRKITTGNPIPPSDPFDEFRLPNLLPPSCFGIKQIMHHENSPEIQRRRDLFEKIKTYTKDIPHVPVFKDISTGVAPYGYPFRADENNVKKITNLALKMGLDCIRWPDLPAEITLNCPLYYKNTWIVNFKC